MPTRISRSPANSAGDTEPRPASGWSHGSTRQVGTTAAETSSTPPGSLLGRYGRHSSAVSTWPWRNWLSWLPKLV